MRNLLLAVALVAATSAGAAYKCKDERGITHIGDTPPDKCANVVMYEISRSGMVLRTIEPTLTEEQARAKAEEAARAKEKARLDDEQRRKDLALLATYTSPKDIEVTRDRNLEPIKGRIRSAQERLEAVGKRQKELEDEMEFYKAGKGKNASKTKEAPIQLRADLERTVAEKTALANNLVTYEKEMAQVRTRYDGDRDRWVELKKMQADGRLDLRDPKAIEAAKKNDPTQKPGVKKYNLYLVPAN
jgi:chromosome segregation ATPase